MASSYPRIPGHEVAGTVEAVGEAASRWEAGQRVGVGWFGGACFECDSCRRGDFVSCRVVEGGGQVDVGCVAVLAPPPLAHSGGGLPGLRTQHVLERSGADKLHPPDVLREMVRYELDLAAVDVAALTFGTEMRGDWR